VVTYSFTDVASSQDLFQLTKVSASASVNASFFSPRRRWLSLSQSEVSSFNASFLAWVSIERGWDYTTSAA